MIYEKSKTSKISFPLGGIGSGCIGLSGDGQLVEWEIFNRPSKATRNGYSHFAIKARRSNGSVTRVLQGDTNENLMGTHTRQLHMGYGYGPRTYSMAGFPHFKDLRFEGTFPVAKLTFRDDPLYFEDLLIIREAGAMATEQNYDLFIDKRVVFAAACLILGTVLLAVFAGGVLRGW